MAIQSKRLEQLQKFLKIIISLSAAYYIGIYIAIAFFRIPYPFELEWIEGGIADHVMRILDGLQLYDKPSIDFVAYIYTPLYYYLSLPFFVMMGKTLAGLRVLSFLASLGAFYFIYLIVRRETASRFSALAAVGLFASCFQLCGAWFDIARSDSLLLLLLLATIYVVRDARNARAMVFSALLLALAFLTKQPALVLFPFLAIYLAVQYRSRAVIFVTAFVMISGSAVLILDFINNGWFTYYTFALPSGHEFVSDMLIDFWLVDMIGPLGIAIILGLFYLFSQKTSDKYGHVLFAALTVSGLILISWLGRLHFGGWDNVLMPACAGVAIMFGIGLNSFLEEKTNEHLKYPQLANILISLLVLAQFYFMTYDPTQQLPTSADREAGEQLLNVIKETDGEVLLPYHGYLCRMAGKKSHLQNMAMIDLIRGDGLEGLRLTAAIEQAIKKQRFAAIILNAPWYPDLLEKHYKYEETAITSDSLFWPVTGFQTRPAHLFVPIDN